MCGPGIEHLEGGKNLIRYLNGTRTIGVVRGSKEDSENPLHGYFDSDFAEDVEKHNYTSMHYFLMTGGLISWTSKKQGVVAQSAVR